MDLIEVVIDNNIKRLKAYTNIEEDINMQDTHNGYTPLMYAIRYELLEIAEYLINVNGIDFNIQNIYEENCFDVFDNHSLYKEKIKLI